MGLLDRSCPTCASLTGPLAACAPLAIPHERRRLRVPALLAQLREEDLRRTAQHPEFGTVTLAELVATWAAHDLNHTVQAERALMQPFVRGCGPWRAFFGDHAVAGAG